MRKLCASLAVVVAVTLAASGQVTIPYTFTAGTVISPDEVNTNFSTLGTSACNVGGCTMTGVLKLAAGSAAAPSATFAAETNTGMYRVAAGSIGWTLAGTQRMRLDGSGLTVYGGTVVNTSGQLAAAQLTGTAAAINGSNITNLAAANLTGTAAAINGSNITNLAAANLTGTAAAINGSNITSLTAANLTGTAAAVSGVNITALNATNLGSGTVPTARLGTGSATSATFLRGDQTWADATSDGTWTPVLGGAGGTTGQTYSVQTGHYVKVGKLVYATFNITLTAKGTITGAVQIQGLPFTSASGITAISGAFAWSSLASGWTSVVGQVASSTTVAAIVGEASITSSNQTALDTAAINNNTTVLGTIIYEASS